MLLLQQLAAHQPGDGGVVGEDADLVSAPFDPFVQALERVGAPDLAPVLLEEVQERQHVVASGLHHRHGVRELLAQHLGDPLLVSAHLIGGLDHEHRLHGSSDHVLASLGDVAEQVALKVHAAQLRNAAHLSVRSQLQPWNIHLIAAVSPRWASEITSRVPVRPRSYCFADAFG